MLKTLLLGLMMNAAAEPNVVQRCEAVWDLTVALPGESYSGDWCEGAGSALILVTGDEERRNQLVGTLQIEQGKLRLELARDSAPEQPLWLGLELVSATAAQPLKSTQAGAAKAILQLQRRDGDGDGVYLNIHVVNQPSAQIMQSITRATGIKLLGAPLTATRVTFHFSVIPVNSVISLLASGSELQLTFQADGTRSLVRARDGKRSAELAEQYWAQVAQSGFDAGAEILGQLRALERLRSAQDMPVLSGLVHFLAQHYEQEKDYAQLLGLRREELALASRVDARPLGLGLAGARADLARALQLTKSAGSEDLTLLRQAMPVLQAELLNLTDRDQLEKFAQAYAQRGFNALALQLSEHAFSRCVETIGAVSASDWLYECDDTSVALLQRYRKSGDASKAQASLASWHRVAIEAPDDDQVKLALKAQELKRQGQWRQALELSDIALSRMPLSATSDAVKYWSNLALLAQFANGQYARAARSFARNRGLLARVLPKDSPVLIERAREQTVLDLLAQGEPLEIGWWTRGDQLSASQLPPLSNPKDAEYEFDGLFGLALSLQRSLEFGLAQEAQGSSEMVTVAEGYALLMTARLAMIPSTLAVEQGLQQFETAQTWRKNAGQSADELAQRAAWFSAKQKAILALMQGQSANTQQTKKTKP